MPEELKSYFAVLSLIAKNDFFGKLPHIPYSIAETDEAVSDRVSELRGGEGYTSDIGQYAIYDDAMGLVAKDPLENKA